jgi:hypothetical protein
MRRIVVALIVLVLGAGFVLEGSPSQIDASSSWSQRGRSMVRNATAESAYMEFVPTAELDEVVTRKRPEKVQLRVKWIARKGHVPVEVKWTRWCWNEVSGEIEGLVRRSPPRRVVWLTGGDTFTRTWNTSKDYCAVSAEASTEKPEPGRLVLVVRDRR